MFSGLAASSLEALSVLVKVFGPWYWTRRCDTRAGRLGGKLAGIRQDEQVLLPNPEV